MEKIARKLGFDPLEFRLKNAIRPGEFHPFSTAWNEGREPRPEIIHTVGLEECVRKGKAAIGWDEKYGNEEWHAGTKHASPLRKGIGVALVMQGTAIPYLDMGGASIKMNDDGSFNLLVGATDLGLVPTPSWRRWPPKCLASRSRTFWSTRPTPISPPSTRAHTHLQRLTFLERQ